ncbi:unnamed protein product [Paramecium octaurelia]|uniref:Uncharacterized protein n=1 Tax=Paramecium octaurelia TaxID=43137 RepID=A0A8S1YNT3_PAROT|nr:unnamed protein product [Paramecium octaurelia]
MPLNYYKLCKFKAEIKFQPALSHFSDQSVQIDEYLEDLKKYSLKKQNKQRENQEKLKFKDQVMENLEILLSLDYWRGQRFGEQRLPKQNIRDQETQICGFDIETCFSKKLHFNKFFPLKKVLLEQPDNINRDIRISQFSFASFVQFQKCQLFWQKKNQTFYCVEQQKTKKQYSQMIIQNKLRFETRFTVHLILLSRILN